MENTAITPIQKTSQPVGANTQIVSPFSAPETFEISQRMAKCLAASSLVPETFSGNPANCMIAIELAARFGYSPFLIMQNLYVIHGRPGFSSQFIISAIQSCGRYGTLHYKWTTDENGKKIGCRAEAVELATGETLTGAEVTLEMAKREGWSTKNGSKWITLPEQMMMYRAAAFFGRIYAPDILLGMKAEDELVDIYEQSSNKNGKMSADAEKAGKNNYTAKLNTLVEAETVDAVPADSVTKTSETPSPAFMGQTAGMDMDAEKPELVLQSEERRVNESKQIKGER